MPNYSGEQSPILAAVENELYDFEGGFAPSGTFLGISLEVIEEEPDTIEGDTE